MVYGPAPEQDDRKTRTNQERSELHKTSDMEAETEGEIWSNWDK
jgi:hypothetical protein